MLADFLDMQDADALHDYFGKYWKEDLYTFYDMLIELKAELVRRESGDRREWLTLSEAAASARIATS
jgi:hypothetical protein